MPTERVLLLLPTTSYKAHDFLAAARRLGVEVVVGTDRAQALERQAGETSLAVDLARPEKAAARIAELASRRPFAAVLGVDDETTLVASLAARRLGLPHNPPEAVADTRDKLRFRRRLDGAGLRQPRAAAFPRDADPCAIAGSVPYPCVLKPTFLSASRGVIRADEPESFAVAFRRLARLLEEPGVRVRGGAAADTILVEEYVPGAELALEGLLRDGNLEVLRLFDKPDPLEGPYFEETLYISPARVQEEVRSAVIEAIQDAVTAVGLRQGPLHAEVRLSPTGPVVLEMAPRTIGGLCGRAVRFADDASLEQIVLCHALGRPLDLRAASRAAGVLMLPIPGPGVLRRVDGLQAARALPGVREVTVSIARDSEVVPLPEGNRYLGFVIADGDAPDSVEATLRLAHRQLDVVIEPPAATGAAE